MLKKHLNLLLLLFLAAGARAQTQPTSSASPNPAGTKTQATQNPPFNLSDFGVSIKPDPRLIVVMAALDAAGFDPTPTGKEPSPFRALVRKDQAGLNPDLRIRMREFLERNRLPAPATAADEAARYVSLAYALGPPPALEAPDRSDDLPGGVLEVLDFAPLLHEFYQKSGIDERLPSYLHAYQAEGDRLRQPAGEMVNAVLSYLHTRPILVRTERVRVKSPDKKKSSTTLYSTREHERKFFIVPDLMATPDTINFRIIADDYYAIVPEGIDPASSEMRRAYLQFVIDPLVLKFNKEIASHRDQIKQLEELRSKDSETASPDVFVTVTKSLVAAADIRFEEASRLAALTALQRYRLQQAKDDAGRKAIAAEGDAARSAISDEVFARLAEEYDKGALLDFLFADQLKEVQASGFDVAGFFPDLLLNIDPARENKRLSETAAARERALSARRAHPRYSMWLIDPTAETHESAGEARLSAMLKKLEEVEKLWQVKEYQEAESRLRAMLADYPGDPRLLFTLGQTASLWARDTTDDNLQTQRLNRALASYRLAVAAASPETDKVLLSRAHEAMGRILAFLDQDAEAMKEFEAAISIGEVPGGAYQDALAGKKKLSQP